MSGLRNGVHIMRTKMRTALACRVAATLAALVLPLAALASSHREAPLISADPLADNTDLYVFRSPDLPNTITLLANYHPMQLPQGGPNYYSFGENIRYEIHVENDGTAGDDIIYRFTFTKVNQDLTTFFNIRTGQQNQKLTYTMEKSINGGPFSAVISNGVVPPNDIGPRSIQGAFGLSTTYSTLVNAAITTASSGEKVFCGPADDPYFADIGALYDIADAPRANPRDGMAKFNVSTIAIQADISALQKNGLGVGSAANILDSDYVIGVWASASRQQVRTLNGDGTQSYSGAWVQVSRVGMPLTNEWMIPIGMKDHWNAVNANNEPAESGEGSLGEYFYNPEFALYMDNSLFGGAVPALSPLRIQRNSLQSFDFGSPHDGLWPILASNGGAGTALDVNLFGPTLLKQGKSRSLDLWPMTFFGLPNLSPYQLATGKNGNPLAVGKPFVNNFMPTSNDMLRLNMAVPPTQRNDPSFSSLGLVQAAVLGLTTAPYNTNASLQLIPNMDGFPNGRRLEDDVVRIELQSVSGFFLAAIGFWYDDFVSGNPVTQDLLDVLGYTTGIEANSPATFRTTFPYVLPPHSGTGPASGKSITYVQPAILPPSNVLVFKNGFE